VGRTSTYQEVTRCRLGQNMFKSMSVEDYISKRVDQFQGWYNDKAVRATSAYLRVRTTAVIGSALVPVVANITLPSVACIPTGQFFYHDNKFGSGSGRCAG
jgi:hypothetical protein